MHHYKQGRCTRHAHKGIPAKHFEEEQGRGGFYGPASHLIKPQPSTRWTHIEGPLRPHMFDLLKLQPHLSGFGTRLLYNTQLEVSFLKLPDLTRPALNLSSAKSSTSVSSTEEQSADSPAHLYRNADGDTLYFCHSGQGQMLTEYGLLNFEAGQYILIPKCVAHAPKGGHKFPRAAKGGCKFPRAAKGGCKFPRDTSSVDASSFSARGSTTDGTVGSSTAATGTTTTGATTSSATTFLVIESRGSRFREPDRGLVGRTALYDINALQKPDLDAMHSFKKQHNLNFCKVLIKREGVVSCFEYDKCVLDAVGWKGDLWPFTLHTRDLMPLMSPRVHLPPSAHSTFVADGFIVCTFLPRPLEEDADALRLPFYHQNIDYDEVLFYHAGDFFSRDNLHAGMMSFHPAGFPHGPHPKAIKSIKTKTRTDECAVMIDARANLNITPALQHTELPQYWKSWQTKLS